MEWNDKVATKTTRSWLTKFRDAGRGVRLGIAGQRSFRVHIPVAVAVIVAGCLLRVSMIEWGLLTLCIMVVLSAELANSSIETLARAVHPDQDPGVGAALDIAGGAVLIASIGAAIVGGMIFLNRLIGM